MSETKIVFWDVEHGHAAYIQSPNGRHIVVDLGTGSYGSEGEFSPLKHLKSQYGVKQLDYVIITHPHVDHLDDIFNFDTMDPKILLRPKHLDKKPIIENASDTDKPKIEKFFEINERYNVSVPDDSPNSTKNPNNWGGLKIKSFVPAKCAQSNLNIPGIRSPTSPNTSLLSAVAITPLGGFPPQPFGCGGRAVSSSLSDISWLQYKHHVSVEEHTTFKHLESRTI